jgi:hypothetical protein
MIGLPNWLNKFRKVITGGGGGGGGGWSLIGTGVNAASTNGTSVTTPSYNTTGATFIVIVEAAGGSFTPTDSKGNTWTKAVNSASFGGEQSSIWYCASPSTDSSQTFSISTVNSFAALAVYAFTGGAGGVLDKTNSGFNNGSATTVQPGSITPTTNGQLIICALAYKVGSSATINSGFSTPLISAFASGQHYGGAAAFLIQATAAAINPTWTTTSGDDSASIASFK